MRTPLTILAALLALAPDHGARAQRKVDLTEALRAAQRAFAAKDYAGAVRTLQAVPEKQVDERLRELLAAAHAGSGVSLFGTKDYRRARQELLAADRLRPGQVGTLQSLGVVCFQLRDHRAARGYMERVLKLDPDNAEALGVLGHIAAGFDDTGKAGRYFRAAAKAAPGREDYTRLAKKYSKEAAVEEDFATLRRGDFEVRFQRGRTAGVDGAVQTVMGLLQQAHRELEQALGRRSARPLQVVVYTGDQYTKVSSAHAWARAYFDGKLRIAVGAWPAGRDELRRDLRHELTHAFLHELYPNTPLWVHEGYAQVIEGRSVAAARGAFGNGTLQPLPLATFTGRFAESKDVDLVRRGYAQSLAVVGYLLDQGNQKFRQLLAEFRRGIAPDRAVELVYRMKLAEVVERALR